MATEAQVIAKAKKAGVAEYLAQKSKAATKATVEGAKKAAAFATAKWKQAALQPNVPQIAAGLGGAVPGAFLGSAIQGAIDRATAARVDANGQPTTGRKIMVHFTVPVLGTVLAVGSAYMFKKHGVGAAFGMGLGIGALIGSVLRSYTLSIAAPAPASDI